MTQNSSPPHANDHNDRAGLDATDLNLVDTGGMEIKACAMARGAWGYARLEPSVVMSIVAWPVVLAVIARAISLTLTQWVGVDHVVRVGGIDVFFLGQMIFDVGLLGAVMAAAGRVIASEDTPAGHTGIRFGKMDILFVLGLTLWGAVIAGGMMAVVGVFNGLVGIQASDAVGLFGIFGVFVPGVALVVYLALRLVMFFPVLASQVASGKGCRAMVCLSCAWNISRGFTLTLFAALALMMVQLSVVFIPLGIVVGFSVGLFGHSALTVGAIVSSFYWVLLLYGMATMSMMTLMIAHDMLAWPGRKGVTCADG